MKRKIERFLSILVLAGTMILIPGCGKRSADAADGSTGGIVELNMFQDISWLSDAYTVWETGRVTGEIMKMTGVKLNITRAKTGDHEQIQLLIASNDLPDLTVVDYNGTIFGTLSESDMVLDVLDLVQKHAPEMYNTMGKEYWDFYKSESGVNNFYANWAFTPTMGDRYAAFLLNYPVLIARSDIWEEFGKPDILNPEKLRAHLLEVQKKYPNVKPLLTGANEGLGMTSSVYGPLAFIRTSFGIEKYYEAADGTIKANYNHPQFGDYLTWLNDLYRDGIITREEFSGNDEQTRAKREQGNVYMYIAEAHNIKYPPAGNPDAKYEAVPPFSTFGGAQQTELSWLTTFISKKSKHPDAAIKLLSYMNSSEGDRLAFWGQEGVDYVWNDNGVPVRTDWYVDQTTNHNDQYQRERGMLWFSGNYADHEWGILGIPEEEPYLHHARAFYQDPYFARLNFLSLNPSGSIPESITLQQCSDYFGQVIPEIIMSSSRAETLSKFADMKRTMANMGIESVEKYWTMKSDKIKAAFGNNLILRGGDSVLYHKYFD